MMKAYWRWALPAVLVFCVFLVLTMPARHAFGWLGLGQLAVQGIEGTPWSGRATRVALGRLLVGPVVWQARFWALLGGRLEYQLFVQSSGGGGGELRVGRSLWSGTYLADVALSLPAQEVAGQLPMAMATLGGDFLVDLQRVGLSDNWLDALEGSLVWQGAKVLQPVPLDLGSLNMQLELKEGQVVGTLGDDGGPLQVSGDFRLSPDRRYALNALLKARGGDDPQLQQALSFLGNPDAQGRYRLQLSGAL